MGWFKRLLKSKVQINITVFEVREGVNRENSGPISDQNPCTRIVRSSDYRLVEITKADGAVYYYTQEYRGSMGWAMKSDTWFADRVKAVEAHLNCIKHGVGFPAPKDVESVVWEGLSSEEVEIQHALMT